MSKVVFDIETIGFSWDSFDEKQQEYIEKFAKSPEELNAAKEKLGLHPLTGRVVTIALYNPDTEKGSVFFDSGTDQKYNFIKDNIKFESGNEIEILTKFWECIDKYDEYITFNGASFDCPFVTMRSIILNVKCSRDIMPPRFERKPHIDLQKAFMFYGELEKKFPLHFYCKAFNVKSPKEGEVHGHEVPKFFAEGKGLEIAEYCIGDVIATAELYKIWEKFSPIPFKKMWN